MYNNEANSRGSLDQGWQVSGISTESLAWLDVFASKGLTCRQAVTIGNRDGPRGWGSRMVTNSESICTSIYCDSCPLARQLYLWWIHLRWIENDRLFVNGQYSMRSDKTFSNVAKMGLKFPSEGGTILLSGTPTHILNKNQPNFNWNDRNLLQRARVHLDFSK